MMPALGGRAVAAACCAARIARAVSPAALERAGHHARPAAPPRAAPPRARPARARSSSSRTPFCRPARTPEAFAVVRPCRTRITVAMPRRLYWRRPCLAWARDRRQRALPRRHPGRRGLRRARPRRGARAGPRRRRLRVGRPARARAQASWTTSPRRSGCTRWPSRTRSTPTSGPSSSGTRTACSWSSRRSGTSTRTTPSRPARSTCSSGRDFVVTRPARRGLRAAAARLDLEAERGVLAHGPSAVVYAVCDTVVDGYEVVDGARGRRRRGRGVGLLPEPGPRTRRGSTSSSARSRRCAARCCPCASRCGRFASGIGARHRRRTAAPFFRDVADHLIRCAETIDDLDGLLSTAFDAHLARISVQQNEDMRKISAGAALVAVPTLIAGDLRDELRPHARAGLAVRLPVGAAGHGARRRRRPVAASSRGPAGCSPSGQAASTPAPAAPASGCRARSGRARTAGRSACET